MASFRPVRLTRFYNAAAHLPSPPWHRVIEEVWQHLPRGKQRPWGIPFQLGPEDVDERCVLVPAAGEGVRVPARGRATHVCVLHFCGHSADPAENSGGGEVLAEYRLHYPDGGEHRQRIRRRFEVQSFALGWGSWPFAAVPAQMPRTVESGEAGADWGWTQTGVSAGYGPFATWLYAIENPHPERELAAVTFRTLAKAPLGILGLTLCESAGHPLRHVPRRVYRLTLPAAERVTTDELRAELDMGIITRLYAAPAVVNEAWVKAADAGLGHSRDRGEPRRAFLLEATGSEGAVLTTKAGKGPRREVDFGEAWRQGRARSADGRVRLELLHPRSTWVHVEVRDADTGEPAPTRLRFLGPNGEYIPPYGHHAVINDRWFEDYGGDLQLGGASFAYVPGRFQIELPVGEVYVEASKGFEYLPLRRKLEIKPGQRQLRLRVRRWTDQRAAGWVTADTHVHFISPQTAWLEGQGEGLNLINLLASQWGRLYTNVADITGDASGCSTADTIVWVGTENRHHLLGHISMLGTHGDPVFPMTTGGPDEAYIGDPDVTTLTEWARTCKEREGVVIRPHFPAPICEEPVYFVLGELDGAELRQFADPAAGSLDEFCFQEWYRYLNCGYRVAAVGGTDKMSAGMPVGGVRTYAKLGPDEEFSFESWGRAVRAGRTVTTSGPLLHLTVEGREIGHEIRLPAGGGTVEVAATAECIWPMHALEIVVNGQVVASTSSARGAKRLALRDHVRIDRSSWLAARCGSSTMVHHCWPIRLGAHTSPVYLVCGQQEMFSPSDATYMLTLINGGLTWLDTLSVRYDEQRHRKLKAIYRQAQRILQQRMRAGA